MPTQTLKARHGIVLRATSGALTAADRPLPLFDLEGHRRAIVHIMQEAALVMDAGDDRVRFLLETAYGAGDFVDSTANTVGVWPDAGIEHETELNLETTDGTQFVVGDIIRVDQEQMLVVGVGVAFGGANFVRARRGHKGDSVQNHTTATDIFIQDVDWITVANVTYVLADNGTTPAAVVVLGSTDTSPVILDDLDEALTDDTILAAPLGDRLRLRVAVVGATAPTYNYSARVSLQN
jgi:hypothetical protein